jgi:hypothetical protein
MLSAWQFLFARQKQGFYSPTLPVDDGIERKVFCNCSDAKGQYLANAYQ